MPSEDYTSVTRGALKLKGAKVHKSSGKKSKKSKDKTSRDLETALQRTSETEDDRKNKSQEPGESEAAAASERKKSTPPGDGQEPEDLKTDAERRFAEIKRKRVRYLFLFITEYCFCIPSSLRWVM